MEYISKVFHMGDDEGQSSQRHFLYYVWIFLFGKGNFLYFPKEKSLEEFSCYIYVIFSSLFHHIYVSNFPS